MPVRPAITAGIQPPLGRHADHPAVLVGGLDRRRAGREGLLVGRTGHGVDDLLRGRPRLACWKPSSPSASASGGIGVHWSSRFEDTDCHRPESGRGRRDGRPRCRCAPSRSVRSRCSGRTPSTAGPRSGSSGGNVRVAIVEVAIGEGHDSSPGRERAGSATSCSPWTFQIRCTFSRMFSALQHDRPLGPAASACRPPLPL